ncbi:MAG: hypothetical protein ACREJQ_02925, partial [bacterium]
TARLKPRPTELREMTKRCESCSAPLDEAYKGASEHFCKFCSDETGKLKSRGMVQMHIAGWLLSWQKDIDILVAHERAAHFMKAMPAWAEDKRA